MSKNEDSLVVTTEYVGVYSGIPSTSDIGYAIANAINSSLIPIWRDARARALLAAGSARVKYVDSSDPNNIVVHTYSDDGDRATFRVTIVRVDDPEPTPQP
jgi:hypothetical protein